MNVARWWTPEVAGAGGRKKFDSRCWWFGNEGVGRDCANTGRATGCIVFCVGVDANRLEIRLVYVSQPRIKRPKLTWVVGSPEVESRRFRVRMLDYIDPLECKRRGK